MLAVLALTDDFSDTFHVLRNLPSALFQGIDIKSDAAEEFMYVEYLS
jgi:hypothetical protein